MSLSPISETWGKTQTHSSFTECLNLPLISYCGGSSLTLNAVCGDLLVDKISLSVELIYAEEDNIQGGHLDHEKNLVRV